jgi:peptide/nickel transport system permease protein
MSTGARTLDLHDGAAGELDGGTGSPGRRRSHPILRFLARRFAAALGLLLIVSALIFASVQILPGDAAYAVLGRNATPDALRAIRLEMGLDKPASQRYVDWLGGLVRGDLGRSLASHTPVSSLIGERFANTFVLALVTAAVLLPLALLLGAWAGTRVARLPDHAISVTSLVLIAIPEFVLGTFLIIFFALKLKLLPPVSLILPGSNAFSSPQILVLPVATLVCVGLGYMVRLIRAGVVDAMASDYVQTARLNGVSERRVVVNYALRNALAPSVQITAITLQWLIGGIFIVENLFGYPGIGQGLVQAVIARDIPYVQSVAILLAALYITINIFADLAVVLLVPKLRTAQ